MQANNNLRVFSGDATNVIADSNLETAVVTNGAAFGAVASSALYNTLSKLTTLACTSLIDFVALQNPSVTFGQDTPIENWITAVNNAFASKSDLTTLTNGLTNGTTVVQKSTYAEYASTDTSKGTIEQRLTSLGFREGSILLDSSISSEFVTLNELKRQGNYVNLNLKITMVGMTTDAILGNIPVNFRPKEEMEIFPSFISTFAPYYAGKVSMTVKTNGDIIFNTFTGYAFVSYGQYYQGAYGTDTLKGSSASNFEIMLGYEANPISINN